MKRFRVGSVCVALMGAATLAAAVYGQEKKDSPAAPNSGVRMGRKFRHTGTPRMRT